MYRPKSFAVDDDELLDLIERGGFGQLVSVGSDGFTATGLPVLLDRDRRTMRGHVARANRQWKELDGAPVLVLFQLTAGYVTPAWYPSKAEHGRVVPTWDYEVVHVHGVAHVHDDVDWVHGLVTELTDHHEAARPTRVPAPPWAVTDAPSDFVAEQLRAIVGVEIEIERIEGSRKLSQNRPDADRQGVAHGLEASDDPADRALGEQVRRTLDGERTDGPTDIPG